MKPVRLLCRPSILSVLCLVTALFASATGCSTRPHLLEGRPAPNTLSHKEVKAGWELLFDGESFIGWRGFQRDTVPQGWVIADGAITLAGRAGDLITTEQFRDFELRLQWKISSGGNSGIFFRVTEEHGGVYETGPEMQVLHNLMHPDGQNPLTSAGANYGLHAPTEDRTRGIGVWNDVILRVHGKHVQHWLNGVLIVDYELLSPEWEALVADSKFKQWPDYGRAREGHIALQDHGDPVQYRDIKLLRLY